VVRFFESGNVDDLAAAMLDLMKNQGRRESLVRHANEYVARNNWDTRKQKYWHLVDSLVSGTELQPASLSKGSTVCP